jgi:nucleotide-binding universal stress UspA family protein
MGAMASPLLFATDFSDSAAIAQAWAERLSRSLDAPLVIVHAWELPPMMYGLDAAGTPSGPFMEQLGEQAQRSLDGLIADLEKRGVAAKGVLRFGPSAPQICEVAREIGAQIIVCGTHGRGGVGRVIMGSVATRVVHEAERPVLVVPIDKR